jgi:hypothetical protein
MQTAGVKPVGVKLGVKLGVGSRALWCSVQAKMIAPGAGAHFHSVMGERGLRATAAASSLPRRVEFL